MCHNLDLFAGQVEVLSSRASETPPAFKWARFCRLQRSLSLNTHQRIASPSFPSTSPALRINVHRQLPLFPLSTSVFLKVEPTQTPACHSATVRDRHLLLNPLGDASDRPECRVTAPATELHLWKTWGELGMFTPDPGPLGERAVEAQCLATQCLYPGWSHLQPKAQQERLGLVALQPGADY